MKINYNKILKANMVNVFKDVLKIIKVNGLQEGHHLYITFNTTDIKLKAPEWIKSKYPNEMTIIIQHEYWNFNILKSSFNISLSFDNIRADLDIPFDSVISFADPYANFGLRLEQNIDSKEINKNKTIKKEEILKNKNKNKNNIIEFKKFKK